MFKPATRRPLLSSFLGATISVFGLAGIAAAEGSVTASIPVASNASQTESAEEFLAATAPLPSSRPEPRVRPQFGVSVEVPIWLDVDREVVRPGGDLQVWAAADLDYFVVGARIGVGWTPVDLMKSDDPELADRERDPLRRIRLSPELRLQIPGKTLLPYLSNAFDLNWWRFPGIGDPLCAWDFCSGARFTPGYTGRAGLGVHAGKGVYVDLGLAWSFTGEGDFFTRTFWILSPYAGVIFRL